MRLLIDITREPVSRAIKEQLGKPDGERSA
jgi:hypothetical protein